MQHFPPYISEALFEPEQWEIEQFLGDGATMKIEVALEIHSIKKARKSGLKSRQMVCSQKNKNVKRPMHHIIHQEERKR